MTRRTKKKSAGNARTGMAFRGLSFAKGSTLSAPQNPLQDKENLNLSSFSGTGGHHRGTLKVV
jgi:hypothetical protein